MVLPVLKLVPVVQTLPAKRGVVETVGVASPPGPLLTRPVMKKEYVVPLLSPVTMKGDVTLRR